MCTILLDMLLLAIWLSIVKIVELFKAWRHRKLETTEQPEESRDSCRYEEPVVEDSGVLVGSPATDYGVSDSNVLGPLEQSTPVALSREYQMPNAPAKSRRRMEWGSQTPPSSLNGSFVFGQCTPEELSQDYHIPIGGNQSPPVSLEFRTIPGAPTKAMHRKKVMAQKVVVPFPSLNDREGPFSTESVRNRVAGSNIASKGKRGKKKAEKKLVFYR